MNLGHDPEGSRLPIKLDSTSNGEFAPLPLDEVNRHSNRVARRRALAAAKRLGLGRRDFMISLCAAASTLLAFNSVNAVAGCRGGYFALSPEAAFEPQLAQAELGGHEFIFGVQGHYVRPGGAMTLKAGCAAEFDAPDGRRYLSCIGADQFSKDVFLDSDTDMMVLSFVPSRRDAEPLSIEEADATRRIVESLDGSDRLLLHGRVNPNQDGDLQAMDELAERWGVAAWKTYTQWGPDGEGYALTDPVGIAFIEKARSLGVKNICIHKGIPFGRRSYRHSLCTDVGPVAKRYPDVNFLIYHSGWIPGRPEGPYDPGRGEGIDSLIRTVRDNGLGPNSNVYAELGSTWRGLLRDPDSAAHALGKLFRYVGEDNVLWGTDSIWYGSPQDQIQTFRGFQIDEALRDRCAYPALNAERRAKVFGLNAARVYGLSAGQLKQNAARDRLAAHKANYLERPDPHFLTHGPRTRRAFLQLLHEQGDVAV